MTPKNPQTSVKLAAPAKLAFYIRNLSGGGAERSMLLLAGECARRGFRVDFIIDQKHGAYLDQVPAGLRLVVLQRGPRWKARFAALRAYPGDVLALLLPVLLPRKPLSSLRYVRCLADYLRRERPRAMISAMSENNLVALWARQLASVDTRLLISEHNNISHAIAEGESKTGKVWRARYLPGLVRRCYPRAEAIVAVARGTGDDLARTCNLARPSIATIYNPVVSPTLCERAAYGIDSPWFAPDAAPVILAAGRLTRQKGFHTLLQAFALLRQTRVVRLVILGEGRLRSALQAQIGDLNIQADVHLPGWVSNPYKYMRAAAVFACSSEWEGLGNVIIEAMACGCPVVATDCPSGPREILADGQYGRLVAPGDAYGLARALGETLQVPRDSQVLRERAEAFGVVASADQYLRLLAISP